MRLCVNGFVAGSLLRPEIDDECILKYGAKQLAKRFVFGVGEIGVAVLFGVEGEDEAMGEALVELLGADVGAPIERSDSGNLFLEGGEGLFDFGDVVLAC